MLCSKSVPVSGYQAAVLAHLARKVCTIEIIPAIGPRPPRKHSETSRMTNVSVRPWRRLWWLGPECGPFDAIVVTRRTRGSHHRR